ncbi:hypothetical protein FRC09_007263 [Ceratobasidium sp. 395]|nr:hypothetical protein FRC09_007263 [Ceratobasidium sp. 395]
MARLFEQSASTAGILFFAGKTDLEDSSPTPLPHQRHESLEGGHNSSEYQRPHELAQGDIVAILSIPIEVFSEIAGHLHPLDVIQLSRSSKHLRKLLMQRAAMHIWQRSLENVPGLPPCPSHLCEPQYAALIFTEYCSFDPRERSRHSNAYPPSAPIVTLKCRLHDEGWDEADWIFPNDVVGEWLALIGDPEDVTDDVWKTLYAKLIPYLEENRKQRTAQTKIDNRRRRERRMRWLLVDIKKRNVLLKVHKTTMAKYADRSDEDPVHDEGLVDDDLSWEDEDSSDNIPWDDSEEDERIGVGEYSPKSRYVVARRPFPPLVDALEMPVIAKMLKKDGDADALERGFDSNTTKIKRAILSWSDAVEKDLVKILKLGDTKINSGQTPTSSPSLNLRCKAAPRYLQSLSSNARLLLRADSVFRFKNDDPCPPPLYYPEMFSIFQDRPEGYFEKQFFSERPKRGYPWKMSNVAYYAEGVTAAKALLEELGRRDAAQFELQALGERFTCGACLDQWPRTWNEIVHHYAQAGVHARIAEEHDHPAKQSTVYNSIHFGAPSGGRKGKNKPLVILLSPEETETTSKAQDRSVLAKCNLCDQLGIKFHAPQNTISKHVSAVHGIKTPKADHYTRTRRLREHAPYRPDLIEPVSDTSDDGQPLDIIGLRDRTMECGPTALWTKQTYMPEDELDEDEMDEDDGNSISYDAWMRMRARGCYQY